MVGFQRVDLEPGQFIFGRKKASFDLKLSEQEVRTCLKHLENYENITIKSTNKYTLVTLNKWEQFQGEDIADNQQSNQHVTSNQPTSNQQVTTYKNDKNVKNEKNLRDIQAEARQVLAYLNEKKGAAFRNAKNITPRLKEGYTVDDCKLVIDTKMKDQHFIQNPKYLNPETLFRQSNFEKYLNETGKMSITPPSQKSKLPSKPEDYNDSLIWMYENGYAHNMSEADRAIAVELIKKREAS